jgi:hypothetical protein
MDLKFNKEDKKWYIDLPSYPGEKADLQMVLGADTLLDILSGNTRHSVTMSVSLEPIEGFDSLTRMRQLTTDEGGGAMYFSNKHQFELWLCDVTKFVFAPYGIDFPSTIFYKGN